MAETLKYFYLIFSPPDLIDLNDYVFNTEAHPLLRRRAWFTSRLELAIDVTYNNYWVEQVAMLHIIGITWVIDPRSTQNLNYNMLLSRPRQIECFQVSLVLRKP